MLRPFFSYYGSKFRIAPKYPAPMYGKIIEPFAGSAGYATRYFDAQVTLNDIDPIICAVWSYIIESRETEIMSLPLVFDHVDELNICQEAKYLIGFWLNKGVSSPRKQPSAWFRQGIRPNSQWGEAMRYRVASQQRYIRHWLVINESYADMKNERATWFIDPPYCSKAGRQYRFNKIDYPHLGAWCKSREGQTIVCESEGAEWLEFDPFLSAKVNESKTGGKQLKEVIYLGR